MDPAGELAQLGDRLPRPRPGRGTAAPASPASPREAARPSVSESVTSRCWAPSWRLRSIRRRSASSAATIRARDARTSASWARTSAARRSFSSTSPAVARTDSTSAGSSSSAGSWTSAATSSPPRGDQRDRPVRRLRQLDRPAAGVDVAAVGEAVRNVERRVAEHAREPLAQAGRLARPQLDDEVGRRRAMQPRPDDPATTPSGISSATARTAVSSVGGFAARGGDDEPEQTPRPRRSPRSEQERGLRAPRRTAQRRKRVTTSSTSTASATAMPRSSCARSTASAALCRGTIESTSRPSGSTKAPRSWPPSVAT